VGVWTSTPYDATANTGLTAAIWDATVRDGFNAFGALTPYTPSLGGFTQGNGTVSGAYSQIQKWVYFEAQFVFGSTSAAASATPTLSLPVTASTSFQLPGLLSAYFIDTGTATYQATAYMSSSTVVSVRITGTNGAATAPTTTTPHTWASTDVIKVAGLYIAA
jgi:hypothetical protein